MKMGNLQLWALTCEGENGSRAVYIFPTRDAAHQARIETIDRGCTNQHFITSAQFDESIVSVDVITRKVIRMENEVG